MSQCLTQPPWEFLLTASRNTLQSYELTRLSHAANLRKEIGAMLDQWVAENNAAMLARLLLELRERPPHSDAPGAGQAKTDGEGDDSASDNFFANPAFHEHAGHSTA